MAAVDPNSQEQNSAEEFLPAWLVGTPLFRKVVEMLDYMYAADYRSHMLASRNAFWSRGDGFNPSSFLSSVDPTAIRDLIAVGSLNSSTTKVGVT